MAAVMTMKWPGVKAKQYDEVLTRVDWENNPADGGIFHVAWFTDEMMMVLDVWEKQADFDRFMSERLGPALQEVGVEGEPQVMWYESHRYFNTEGARAGAAA